MERYTFDLQMFGAKITDVAIKELSLIFGEHKGQAWAPINGEAKVLAVKGAPSGGFLNRFIETLKGWGSSGWPVSAPVPDNVDGDGDGQDDYNAIVGVLTNTYYDLSAAMSISDDAARAAAVCAVIDNFKACLDRMYAGEAKAGARHSKTDMQHLGEIAKHASAIGDSLKALGVNADGGSASGADDEDDDVEDTDDEEKAKAIVEAAKASDDIAEDGLPAHFSVEIDGKTRKCKAATYDKLVAVAKADKKKSEEPYGDVEYADPGYQKDKKKRYPIDTEAHARSAWSYINKESNASKYSAEDLAKVKDKIRAACKKFGIEIDGDKDDKGAPTSNATGADLTALLDAAVAKAKAELQDATKAQIEAAVTAAKAEHEGQIASLNTELEKTRNDLSAANALIKGIAKDALAPSSPGFTPTRNEKGESVDPLAESTKNEAADRLQAMKTGSAKASSISEVIALQRLANG